MVLAEALGLDAVPRPGEDLRHRRRRGGPGPGPARRPTTPGRSRASRRSCWRSTSSETNGRYAFHKDLRRSVIFGRHDLIQDAPISRIDLLSCRNTLMYFNAETQARILERFHFALNERGFLFLGKAETLLTYNSTLRPGRPEAADLRQGRRGATSASGCSRWRRTGDERGRSATWSATSASARRPSTPARWPSSSSTSAARSPWPTTGPAPCSTSPPPTSAGPLQDLQVSYRPAELRSCIDRAYAERRPVVLKDVEWSAGPRRVAATSTSTSSR